MIKRLYGFVLLGLGGVLAAIQLFMFDSALGTVHSWTDSQAESWTIYSPFIDGSILAVSLLLVSVGVFVALSSKKLWLRTVLSGVALITVWALFYTLQLVIQWHVSGFRGV